MSCKAGPLGVEGALGVLVVSLAQLDSLGDPSLFGGTGSFRLAQLGGLGGTSSFRRLEVLEQLLVLCLQLLQLQCQVDLQF